MMHFPFKKSTVVSLLQIFAKDTRSLCMSCIEHAKIAWTTKLKQEERKTFSNHCTQLNSTKSHSLCTTTNMGGVVCGSHTHLCLVLAPPTLVQVALNVGDDDEATEITHAHLVGVGYVVEALVQELGRTVGDLTVPFHLSKSEPSISTHTQTYTCHQAQTNKLMPHEPASIVHPICPNYNTIFPSPEKSTTITL